jgi:DNA polymerase
MIDKKQTLEELYSQHRNNPTSPLIIDNNTNLIFGEGDLNASLMFVGEAPGRDEDIQKRPLVGRAGQLLNNILNSFNIKREDVFITNIIKTRPTKNRTPTPQEITRCWPFLLKQIHTINPKIIVTLGTCATQIFLKTPFSITKVHGYPVPFEHYIVVPTLHPAFILRNSNFHSKLTEDIRFAIELIKNITKNSA